MLAGVPGYAEPALQQESFKTARETWPTEEQEEPEPEPEPAGAAPASAEAPGAYEGHTAPEEGPIEPAANIWEADARERAPSDQPGTPSRSEPMTSAPSASGSSSRLYRSADLMWLNLRVSCLVTSL